jgi:hypothetical protein
MARSGYSKAVEDAGSLLFALTVGLAFLKFCNVIDWSWWGVFAPMLLPVAAALVLMLYFVFVGVVVVITTLIAVFIERIRW